MMGHQYGNLQQRINSSENTLDKEFNHLRKSSKQNNKIKIFRIRAEYNSNTARIIDYISNAYGVGDVNENEKIKKIIIKIVKAIIKQNNLLILNPIIK